MDATTQKSVSGFGMRLKEAREQMQLSQKEAAIRLHLSTNIIQLLETEDFRNAPPATFMRGYLKSYARLLNLTENEVSTALLEANLDLKADAPITPLLNVMPLEKNDSYTGWSTSFIVLILAVLVGMWWNSHGRYTTTPLTNNVAQPLTQAAPPPTAAPVNNPLPAAVTVSPITTPPAASQPEVKGAIPAQMPAPVATTQPTVDTALPTAAGTPAGTAANTPPSPPLAATTPLPALNNTLPPSPTDTPAKNPATQNKTLDTRSGEKVIMALPEPGL